MSDLSIDMNKNLHKECWSLTPEAAKALIDKGAVVIDVRSQQSQNALSITGSIQFEKSDVIDFANDNADTNIILYCNTGGGARATALEARNANCLNVFDIAGGLYAWSAAGFPVMQRFNP